MATLVIPQAHGSQSFTTAGTYSFTVPLSNVSQITVIAQGGGAAVDRHPLQHTRTPHGLKWVGLGVFASRPSP